MNTPRDTSRTLAEVLTEAAAREGYGPGLHTDHLHVCVGCEPSDQVHLHSDDGSVLHVATGSV